VVCVRAVRAPGSTPVTEAPYVESRLDVPDEPLAGART
jgi:carbon starvation protein